jgi:hypothetical protein
MTAGLLATWSFETSRRLFEIGIIVAGVGAGVLGLGAVWVLVPAGTETRRLTWFALAASVLLVVGFILMVLSTHYGLSPFRRR